MNEERHYQTSCHATQRRRNAHLTTVRNWAHHSPLESARRGGLFGIVVSLGFLVFTNQAHTAFIKVTKGPVVEDLERSTTCAWVDYDGDGRLDLIIGNGSIDAPPRNSLYHNLGGGSFQKVDNAVTSERGVTLTVCWADYDRDGDPDLYLGHWQGQNDSLWRNDGGGVFTKIDCPISNDGADSVTGSWVDANQDGWLDLMVCTRSEQPDLFYRSWQSLDFESLPPNSLGELPLAGVSTRGAAWADINNDGAPDVALVYADPERNALLVNDGEGNFTEVMVDGFSGVPRASGLAWGDFDNDGLLDLFVANADWAPNALFRNLGGEDFVNVAVSAGLAETLDTVCAAWGDFDNDGFLDLALGNHVGANNRLYHNNKDGTFAVVTDSPVDKEVAISPHAAWVDYDNDGDLDLFFANGDGGQYQRNFLYQNTGNENRWLEVRLEGSASTREGIGAKVRVMAIIDGVMVTQTREISPAGSRSMSDQLQAHFGLGNASQIEAIRVDWPSGLIQTVLGSKINGWCMIREPVAEATPRLETWPLESGAIRMGLTGEIISAGLGLAVSASNDLLDWGQQSIVVWALYPGTWVDIDVTASSPTFYRVTGIGGGK